MKMCNTRSPWRYYDGGASVTPAWLKSQRPTIDSAVWNGNKRRRTVAKNGGKSKAARERLAASETEIHEMHLLPRERFSFAERGIGKLRREREG
jgi:hypothetical protein